MQPRYEELDHRRTPLGELVLRRRRIPGLGDEPVYEITIDGDMLMSSLLNESELALANLAIPAVGDGIFDVLVGGLGLGYTAWAALGYERVRSVSVIELLPEVIEWHETGRVPLGRELTENPRCRFLRGDFFQLVCDESVRDLLHPAEGYGAILVDIDHAPDELLHTRSEGFYRQQSLERAAGLLQEGGVFALWSAGYPHDEFSARLEAAFDEVTIHPVEIFNPMIDEEQMDTVYVARKSGSIPVPEPHARQTPKTGPTNPPRDRFGRR